MRAIKHSGSIRDGPDLLFLQYLTDKHSPPQMPNPNIQADIAGYQPPRYRIFGPSLVECTGIVFR